MNTRGKKGDEGATTKLNEDELDTLRQALAKQEERLRHQSAALERERAAMEGEHEAERERLRTERGTLERERETLEHVRRGAHADPYDAGGAVSTLKEELMRELAVLRRELSDRRNSTPGPSIPAGQRFSDIPESPVPNDLTFDSACVPKISLREATECVPSFDGYNVPLSQFIRACRRARETVPAHYEKPLTKMLMNKLRGRAYYAVEDEPCETMAQLTDLLNGAFGSSKTIDQYRGELSTCYIKPSEHMLDYIARVKELRSCILDAERRVRGTLPPGIVAEIDELTARAFCDGLPSLYRIQMGPECSSRPFDAFAAAKTLAKREELERRRRDPRIGRADVTSPWAANAVHGATPRRGLREETLPRHPTAPNMRDRDTGQRDPAPPRYNPRPVPVPGRPRDTAPGVWCRYCKNPGHEIQDCRKRQFNNSRSGNAAGPSNRPDPPPRAEPSTSRPVFPIEAAREEERESESSN